MTATLAEPGAAGGSTGGSTAGSAGVDWFPSDLAGVHPVRACVAALESALEAVGSDCCWALADAEMADLVSRVHRVEAGVQALRLRLLAEADRRELGTSAMATSTAAWLAADQRLGRREAGRQVRLATDLDNRYEQVRTALASGQVNVEQAQVIAAALDRLPTEVGDEHRRAAEAWLIEQAEVYGPDDLRVLGRRLFEVVDPDAADAHEGRLLEEEEARAMARTRMWMRPAGDGRTCGGFTLPDAQAAMLKAVLDALLAPRRSRPGADPQVDRDPPVDPDLDTERLPYDRRMGLAFCELIEHLPVDGFPRAGRATPTVVVEIDHDALRDEFGSATLSTGGRVSAGQVRRLACNAGILPMVLSGDSTVLDLGRESRFFTWHQRVALARTQHGCVADGCDRPPAWCEAHHCTAWTDGGGNTDLDNGVLLCARHHHLVHATGWRARIAPDGVPELVPPASVDPARTPVRHRRFRRRRAPA